MPQEQTNTYTISLDINLSSLHFIFQYNLSSHVSSRIYSTSSQALSRHTLRNGTGVGWATPRRSRVRTYRRRIGPRNKLLHSWMQQASSTSRLKLSSFWSCNCIISIDMICMCVPRAKDRENETISGWFAPLSVMCFDGRRTRETVAKCRAVIG